jgi:hypothetical protein
MNEPREAKRSPEVKPWVRRVDEAAGVFMPAHADGAEDIGNMVACNSNGLCEVSG